jgi:hypothetical protein
MPSFAELWLLPLAIALIELEASFIRPMLKGNFLRNLFKEFDHGQA